MSGSHHSFTHQACLAGLMIVWAMTFLSCTPTANKPSGPIGIYDQAKDAFMKGKLDEALDLTEKLAASTTLVPYARRSRVLHAVIYTGELKSAKGLAEAYSKGSEKSKNSQFKAAYRRLYSDNLQAAIQAALHLAETAHRIAPEGEMPKELILEANFPTTEGPVEIQQLARIQEGGWIEPDQQDAAAADALRKGVDDALADLVSGDRAKARQAMASGSLTLDGAAFSIFLAKELAEGAAVFDRHHARDSLKLKMLCDEGQKTLKAASALLKDAPDKDKEKEIKKLQDKFKTIQKDA